MSAKDARQLLRKLTEDGLLAERTGGDHVVFKSAHGDFLGAMGLTPSSSRTVSNTEAQIKRMLRACEESKAAARQPPAVSAGPETPPADQETEQARTIRRGARRAQQAAEQASEARAAERIRNKHQRKAKARPETEPPPRREFVRPGRRQMNPLGCVRVTSPDGQVAMYNSDVARKNGKEVRPEDIHVEATVIFWAEAKQTGQAPSCFSCYAPGATGILYYGPVRQIDRRDLYLALGRPLKQAERNAMRDHQAGRLTRQEDGEHVGTGAMSLCERCHDRFAASGLRKLDDDWVAISDWPAFLADLVFVNTSGGIEVRKPGDPPFS